MAIQRYLALNKGSSFLPCLPSDVVFPVPELGSLVAMEEIGLVDNGNIEGVKGTPNGTFELCKQVRFHNM